MFYPDTRLAFPVQVEKPDPLFARMLQQTIGGEEGKVRLMLQYLFQGFDSQTPMKYRNMLLNIGIEEIGHIEMLATAIALNLEGEPIALKEEMATDPITRAAMNGCSPSDMLLRQFLSAGLAATAEDANGLTFNGSPLYASGDIVSNMYSNIAAETTSRALMCRLYEMTDDVGMKEMLWYLIANDTMHQQQWLAIIEELDALIPLRSEFPQGEEQKTPSCVPYSHPNASLSSKSLWLKDSSLGGRDEFSSFQGTSLDGTLTSAPFLSRSHSKVTIKLEPEEGIFTSPDYWTTITAMQDGLKPDATS